MNLRASVEAIPLPLFFIPKLRDGRKTVIIDGMEMRICETLDEYIADIRDFGTAVKRYGSFLAFDHVVGDWAFE